jgi:F-type H+-transporting ATPase subunit b
MIRLAITLATLLLPALAMANEGAEVCNAESWCFQIHGFYILDFLVFIGLLVYFGRKPIAAMLDKRHADVAKEMEAAKALRDEAQAKYDEYTARISGLETELQLMLADVQKGTAVEVERIMAEAQAQVVRLTAEEQQRLEQESKRLRESLQREAATLAVQMAEQALRERLDAAGQQRLVERSLSELGGLKPGAGEVQA